MPWGPGTLRRCQVARRYRPRHRDRFRGRGGPSPTIESPSRPWFPNGERCLFGWLVGLGKYGVGAVHAKIFCLLLRANAKISSSILHSFPTSKITQHVVLYKAFVADLYIPQDSFDRLLAPS